MPALLTALVSGLLFGLGLTISGMVNPAKVRAASAEPSRAIDKVFRPEVVARYRDCSIKRLRLESAPRPPALAPRARPTAPPCPRARRRSGPLARGPVHQQLAQRGARLFDETHQPVREPTGEAGPVHPVPEQHVQLLEQDQLGGEGSRGLVGLVDGIGLEAVPRCQLGLPTRTAPTDPPDSEPACVGALGPT